MLVVGDIMKINYGSRIPVDCVLLAGDIKVDESAINGQPDDMRKVPVHEDNIDSNPNPFMFKDSICTEGSATAMVLAVGKKIDTSSYSEIDVKTTPL